jgi:ABC-type lipoprotein release transport system permease subunit
MLYGMKPFDANTNPGAVVILTLVTLAAAIVPAWRARKKCKR